MGLTIATNLASLATNRQLSKAASEQTKTYERLASGNRITHASDDAAGLSISENLRGQIRSMSQAERNANDGISFTQVAEGGLTEISNIMVRLRELGVQAASDTIGDRERGFVNQEVKSLVAEVDRIANVTTFNGTPLLNGKGGNELSIQVGIRNTDSDRIKMNPSAYNVGADALGIAGMSFETIDGARSSLDKVDSAMNRVLDGRANLGALQNKLEATIRSVGVAKENLTFARSRIADADIAAETSNLMKNNIQQQAAISVLAQANSVPAQALKLI